MNVAKSSAVQHSWFSTMLRVMRAVATNQLARHAPSAYLRLTGQTGRGAAAEEGANDIAAYFRRCLDDYLSRLGVATGDHVSGRTLMEYGPGDLPGVAMLMVAHGAEKVYCVDRFPLVSFSDKNIRVIDDLMQDLHGESLDRIRSCLVDIDAPRKGLATSRVEYLITRDGVSGLVETVDLVFSRAVLEHVNDLEATFNDMVTAMRPGAIAIHLVDLRSHGLHRHNPLDFLEWPVAVWDAMYSEKGVPNRWRVDKYREILSRLPVDVLVFEVTRVASPEIVEAVAPLVAKPFRGLTHSDLGCLGFWLVFRKKSSARLG